MRKTRLKTWAALSALLLCTIAGPVLADPPPIPGHFFEHELTQREVAGLCDDVHALAWTGEDGQVQYLGLVDKDACRERLARKDPKVRELIRKNWNDRYYTCVESRTKRHGDLRDMAEQNCAALSLLCDGRPHSSSLPIERFMCAAEIMARAPNATAGVCVKQSLPSEVFREVTRLAHDAMHGGAWAADRSCASQAQDDDRFVGEMLEMIDKRRGLAVFESVNEGRVRTLSDLGFICRASKTDETPQRDAEIVCYAEWFLMPWHQPAVNSHDVIWRGGLSLTFTTDDVCANAGSIPDTVN